MCGLFEEVASELMRWMRSHTETATVRACKCKIRGVVLAVFEDFRGQGWWRGSLVTSTQGLMTRFAPAKTDNVRLRKWWAPWGREKWESVRDALRDDIKNENRFSTARETTGKPEFLETRWGNTAQPVNKWVEIVESHVHEDTISLSQGAQDRSPAEIVIKM